MNKSIMGLPLTDIRKLRGNEITVSALTSFVLELK